MASRDVTAPLFCPCSIASRSDSAIEITSALSPSLASSRRIFARA